MPQHSALFRALAQQEFLEAFPGFQIPGNAPDERVLAALTPVTQARHRKLLKDPTFARDEAERAVGSGPPTKARQLIPTKALHRQNKVEAARRPFGVAAALDAATMEGLRQDTLETLLRDKGAAGGVDVVPPLGRARQPSSSTLLSEARELGGEEFQQSTFDDLVRQRRVSPRFRNARF